MDIIEHVFVPFYRGAVVFMKKLTFNKDGLTPFSSPFIEERLYL